MTIAPPTLRQTVRTVALADAGDLLTELPDTSPAAWVRGGDGLIGWGEAARLEVGRGPDRFARAEAWWTQLGASFAVDDEVGVPGSGPVAFGSFTFDADSAGSVMVVPRVVLGRRAGRSWLTVVGDGPADIGARRSPQPARRVRYADGSLSAHEWMAAVRAAVVHIRAGRLEKVVLARDLIATSDADIDPRFLLQRLAARFPACFTFACAGLVGATPELLVGREGDRVASGVLAGSVRRGRDAAEDRELGDWLLGSAKDVHEHAISVRSVGDTLARHCRQLDVPSSPHLLQLANVAHLATDITGLLGDGATALQLVADLHPTAAVCGAPTGVAAAVIAELEGMDRGRYTGPVGWTDTHGDGEWGIALRCAELAGRSMRLYAGCGIVADSDAEVELAEAQVKLAAMRDAIEGV